MHLLCSKTDLTSVGILSLQAFEKSLAELVEKPLKQNKKIGRLKRSPYPTSKKL